MAVVGCRGGPSLGVLVHVSPRFVSFKNLYLIVLGFLKISGEGYTTYMCKLIWTVCLQQRALQQSGYPPSPKQTNKRKRASFRKKWTLKWSLKSHSLRNTFLNRTWERNMLESWNYGENGWRKFHLLFWFWPLLEKMHYEWFKIDFETCIFYFFKARPKI